jgi:hypothetical protein
MSKKRLGWKVAAIFVWFLAAGEIAMTATRPNVSIWVWLKSLGLLFASVGLVQYGFQWPRLPRTVWRIFGPFFSCVMIWALAAAMGWLATRMAVSPTSGEQRAAAAVVLALIAGYGAVIIVPLYRLGEWKHLKDAPASDEITALQDTFA